MSEREPPVRPPVGDKIGDPGSEHSECVSGGAPYSTHFEALEFLQVQKKCRMNIAIESPATEDQTRSLKEWCQLNIEGAQVKFPLKILK